MTGSPRRSRLIAIVVVLACFVAGMFLTTSTTTPPKARAPQSFVSPSDETLLGLPWSGEGLGRMVVKDYSTVDQLWVSTETGTLTGIQQGLIGCQQASPATTDEDICYSAGTGGTIRADVYPDDGTSNHLPNTASSLGWIQWVDPLVNGTWWSVEGRNYNGYAKPLLFSGCTAPRRMSGASLEVTGTVTAAAAGTMTCSGSPISVTRGTRYHIVWTNPSVGANPATNWFGINFMTTRAKQFATGATQVVSVLPADRWDVRYKATSGRYTTGGNYRSCTLQGGEFQGNGLANGYPGNQCYHPSMFFSSQLALLYGSGGASGFGYETLGCCDPTGIGGTPDGVPLISSTNTYRMAVFPTTSTTVIGISASIAVKTAGTMTAWVTDSAGTIVSPIVSRDFALPPPLRPSSEIDGLVCWPFPGPRDPATGKNNCTSNSYRVELSFPSPITLSAGTYRMWFGATSGQYAVTALYHISEFPEGAKAKRSSPAVSSSNLGDWDLLAFLIPSGTPGATTTTTTPAPTTTPGGPSIAGVASCVGGTRYEAESITTVGAAFTVNTGYLSWADVMSSYLMWNLPGTGNWVWEIRYRNSANGRRLPDHNSTYLPVLSMPNSSGAWTTVQYAMPAEATTWGRMYRDNSDFGALDLDYIDVCPGTSIVTTTTTAATTTTTSTIVSPLVAVVNVPAANGLTVAPTDSGEVTVTPVSGCTVTGVQMFVDGTFRNTETGAPFNTFAWNNSVNGTITSGTHTFYGIATDSCGNSVTTATRSFIVASGTRVVTLSAFVDANSDGVRQATERIMRSTRWRLFDPAGVQIAGGKLETPSGTLTVPAASGWVVKWYPPLPATTPVVVTIPSSGAASIVVGGCCLNNI